MADQADGQPKRPGVPITTMVKGNSIVAVRAMPTAGYLTCSSPRKYNSPGIAHDVVIVAVMGPALWQVMHCVSGSGCRQRARSTRGLDSKIRKTWVEQTE